LIGQDLQDFQDLQEQNPEHLVNHEILSRVGCHELDRITGFSRFTE